MFQGLKSFLGIEKLNPDVQLFLDRSNLGVSLTVTPIAMLLEICTFSISFFYQVHASVKVPDCIYNSFLSAPQLLIYSLRHSPEKKNFSRKDMDVRIFVFMTLSKVSVRRQPYTIRFL